jgi:hypothetical protein
LDRQEADTLMASAAQLIVGAILTLLALVALGALEEER